MDTTKRYAREVQEQIDKDKGDISDLKNKISEYRRTIQSPEADRYEWFNKDITSSTLTDSIRLIMAMREKYDKEVKEHEEIINELQHVSDSLRQDLLRLEK